MSCTHCTLRELLPPPFSRVASLQLSLVLGRVASLLSYSSLLPHGGPLPQASPLVNGSVAVSGNRRSSGPGGPAAWYCTISWHHHSVRSARRKVVTSFRSSLPHTSWVITLVSRVSFPWLGYSYPLPASWPRSSGPYSPLPYSPSASWIPSTPPATRSTLAPRPGPLWPRTLVFVWVVSTLAFVLRVLVLGFFSLSGGFLCFW